MLLTGKPAWSVKMLAVLLVLTLVPSDGLLLKKCDLKSQLEKAFSDLQGKNNEEMIAKLVCTLGHISGFNTSLVTITDQFNNRFFLQGNAEEYSSEMEELPLKLISDRDTALAEDYNGQDKKQSNPSSIDGGDGSGEASIDQSEENKEIDHGPTNLPPDTTVEPQDIHYDTYEMLYGFTNSPLDSSEEYADYYDEQVRKRKDAPSMDGGDGSGEASIDQSEENKGVDHGPTDLPPDTTVEPTDTIYYDTFGMLFGFTNSPEEYADYFDEQVRKRRDAPSMDGGDGSGEASIDQSEENKEIDHGPTDLPPDTTVEPQDIHYDTYEMLYGFTNSPLDSSEEYADYYDEQVRKRKDAPSMDGGDGSGEASIDQSEENKGVDHGPTDLPTDTTVEPTDTIYYDTFGMLFGFTNSPEEYADYFDEQVRKRRDAPSMDGGDGSGEASIDQSEENKGVDHGSTDLPPDTTVEPTDTIYYDTFGMLFGSTNSQPDTSEEHADYYDYQDRKWKDAPSMDVGDGSGEAPFNQSEENKGVENALQLDTIEPLESDVKQRSKRNAKAQTTLYGIFQLSDIACESGLSPSQNLCGLSCSALTDDDISDDIACLWDLFNSKVERTFTQECLSVDSSVYFAECG